MNGLGILQGVGKLVTKEGEGEASYRIAVWQESNGSESANGSIQADDKLMFGAVGQDATLRLQDGNTVSIIVNRYSVGAGRGEFVVSGPVLES